MVMKTKICTKCKIEKSLSEFYEYKPECKTCVKVYYIKNQKKIRKQQTEYYEENREKFQKRARDNRKQFPWKKLLSSIRSRCNNPYYDDYKYYGGRGIKCLITELELKELWFRDKAWLLDNPSIDRIENDGDYEFNNCQFIEMEINRVKDRYKAILQFDLQDCFIKTWQSQTEAGKQLKIHSKNISACCLGTRKTTGGFKWRFENE